VEAEPPFYTMQSLGNYVPWQSQRNEVSRGGGDKGTRRIKPNP